MKKPAGIVEQVWESRVLRDKAHEAHKAYDKARETHEKAEQACRDIPAPAHHAHQQSLEMYKRIHDTKHKMKEAHGLMAEAYCDYVNHKRNIRSEK